MIVYTEVQYPLFNFSDFDASHVHVRKTDAEASPAFDIDEHRRMRVEAWVEAGNKMRSSRHTKRSRKDRSESCKTPPVLIPNLPSRPDLVKLTPLQRWVGGANKRPPFVGWIRSKDGTTKHAVLELTEAEFEQMDSQFAAHIRGRFRHVAAEKSLSEVTSSDLTGGHWMSGWWYQLHYDLPVSCSVLMECLDSCHPQRGQSAH